MKIKILLTSCFAFFLIEIFGQVAINDDGSPPDPSAILDLQSTSLGLLLPRIDFNDRPVPAPAGLMIFVIANGPQGNNALYIYNGTNWTKLTTSTGGIGDQMEGGIVFWLDTSGVHGLVSAIADLDATEWGCFGTLIGPDAQHELIGTGDTNTAAIVAGCTDDWIAAYSCDTLSLNGYTDWYLPSRDELIEVYNQRTLIGGFSAWLYWTSTEPAAAEFPEEAAWIVNFTDGTVGWTAKSGTLNVRCVRKF
jgi:hypothetical protein